MAGPLLLAADRTLADVAGAVRSKDAAPPPPLPTPEELFAPFTDTLSGLLSGGSHPEAAPPVVDKAPVVATQSRPGPSGGLVPRLSSAQAPGPAGSASSLLQRFRKP